MTQPKKILMTKKIPQDTQKIPHTKIPLKKKSHEQRKSNKMKIQQKNTLKTISHGL